MISSTVLLTQSFYYPLGNTPPNSLTQDLPPEQDADILLLGCGDARNVLFTCFVDNARRIDVTCCDIEPGIHARNVLLYTLLIDDEANLNVDRIWNIYYHWSLDEDSLELLESQIEKLLPLCESIDHWHNSVYGSSIRFCDETSLSRVRHYWSNFSSRDLSPPKNENRISRLKAAIERAQKYRKNKLPSKKMKDITGLRSALPVINVESIEDSAKISKHWWEHGTVPLSTELARRTTHLNPTFLYSPTDVLMLHYGTSPLLGFPLSTAHTPIREGSPFHLPKGNKSSIDHLVDCAKRHFNIWALCFRMAVANKLIIRIFAGDALSFCFSLCSYKQSVASGKKDHWFRTNASSSLIKLLVDQGEKVKPAPLTFDVIDTSNMADHLGALNLMSLGSILLKHHASSSLYTETLIQFYSSLVDRLSTILCSDVRTMPLLLGFVLPDLFTNATNSVEEDYMMGPITAMMGGKDDMMTQRRSRLRWKRSRGFQGVDSAGSGHIEIEPEALAKFLVAVHDEMFKYEDPKWYTTLNSRDPLAVMKEMALSSTYATFNRASFAFLLRALKANVITNWDVCIEFIYNGIFSNNPLGALSLMLNSAQDLYLHMHLFGVDNGRFVKPSIGFLRNAILAPLLPLDDGLPDQLCVTVRVPRKILNKITKKDPDEMGCPALLVSFQDDAAGWLNSFSAVQMTYGKLHKQRKETDSSPYIEEDLSQLSGSSDLYASVFVPTFMLLLSKRSVPFAKVCFLFTAVNSRNFRHEFGPNLCFASYEMTSDDVTITRCMPGTSALPNFTFVTDTVVEAPLNVTTVRLTNDGSKVNSLIRRISLQDNLEAKEKLAEKTSEVKLNFISPFVAVVSIAKSIYVEIQFPAPVSMSKYNLKIARKSSYIEVETPLLDPLEPTAANFMFPLFVSKVPSGAKVPMPWSAMRINLDAMPPIDLKNKETITWMNPLFSFMFSKREAEIRESETKNDVRTDLKDGLLSIFIQFVGLQGIKVPIFGLNIKDLGIQTLIFASNLRLDLANLSVVLDAAIIPLSYEMLLGEEMKQFLHSLSQSGLLCVVNVTEVESVSWKVLLPAMVERCRASNTWKHSSRCEYLKAGKIPLPKGLREVGKSSICSCGIGKCFPPDYLKDLKEKFPEFGSIMNRYATRAAVGPVFAVPYVENTIDIFKDLGPISSQCEEKCKNCGKSETVNSQTGLTKQALRNCSKCKSVLYCSRECQKADWKKHKPICRAR